MYTASTSQALTAHLLHYNLSMQVMMPIMVTMMVMMVVMMVMMMMVMIVMMMVMMMVMTGQIIMVMKKTVKNAYGAIPCCDLFAPAICLSL